MLRLTAIGPFTLVDVEGRDFAPRGGKARAVLVLLAVAPSYTRTRLWLQSKLWSDRAPKQAAGSLRNTLSEIRAALGPHHALLFADRQSVRLDAKAFGIDYAWPVQAAAQDVEPFEDVEARDPEFDDQIRNLRSWIRDKFPPPPMMSSLAAPPSIAMLANGLSPHGRRRVVVLDQEIRGGPAASVAARLFQDHVLSSLAGVDLEAIVLNAPATDEHLAAKGVDALRLNVMAASSDGEIFLSCRIDKPHASQPLWSGNIAMPTSMELLYDSASFARLCRDSVEALTKAMCTQAAAARDDTSAWVLSRQAKSLLFALDKASLREADALLRRAYELEPRGDYLASRAYLRDLAFFQHRDLSFLDEPHAPTDLSLEALRQAPESPVVLTFASQLEYIHQGDATTSLKMVRRSAQIDPTDPMTWAVMSNALIATGAAHEGYGAAQRALELVSRTRHQFLFEHFACMCAVGMKDYRSAAEHARMALLQRPDFVSTRRYEVALAMERGDDAALDHAVAMMRTHEPDFTPSRLLDEHYPVNTLRRLPLIDAISNRAARG